MVPILLCVKVSKRFTRDNVSNHFFFQSITTTSFQACLKDIQRYGAHHDPITLNYMAAGCKYAILCGFAFISSLATICTVLDIIVNGIKGREIKTTVPK